MICVSLKRLSFVDLNIQSKREEIAEKINLCILLLVMVIKTRSLFRIQGVDYFTDFIYGNKVLLVLHFEINGQTREIGWKKKIYYL